MKMASKETKPEVAKPVERVPCNTETVTGFVPCAACAGSDDPVLCQSCEHNRNVIGRLEKRCDNMPHLKMAHAGAEYTEVALTQYIPPGEACGHPGCLNHIGHPCEKCGRIKGRSPTDSFEGAAAALIAESYRLGWKHAVHEIQSHQDL